MSQMNSEQFAQRLIECRLLETRLVDSVVSQVGGREAPRERLESALLQQDLLTNWQIQRLLEGHRTGFFYNQWKILYLVGTGTFARVYRAAHARTGDVRAVKVLRSRYTDDDETRERFMREARTVMRLRHPNIVPIHEIDVFRGRLYMVMDFIEGQNLRDFVRAQRAVKLMPALNILHDVSCGLDYAYQQGVIHRDIKLSNVLLGSTGRASLVDFGLAAIETEDERLDFNPRSVDYAGLEKTTNVQRNDRRSDIFFLGCLVYHMLSGVSPLFETRERIRRMSPERYKQIVPITNWLPQLPHRVVILISRLLELDPEKRVQTPREAMLETQAVIRAIEMGQTQQFDERLTREMSEDYFRRTRKVSEGQNRTLMVVESHPQIQNMLRDKLKHLGYRVLIIGDPHRALERFENLDPADPRPADCVIFGTAGLGWSAIEAFNRFTGFAATREMPALILVREDQMEWTKSVKLGPQHVTIPLPIRFPVVRRALGQLLGIELDPLEAESSGAEN